MNRGILLDFDGTLADSLSQLRDAYFDFLRGFGCEGSLTEFDELNGPPLPEIVHRLKQRYRLQQSEEDLRNRYEQKIMDHQSKILLAEGAHELLTFAGNNGFKVAIVSSSSVERISSILQHHDILSSFDCIVGSENSNFHKPHPDPYLQAIRYLSIHPDQSVAIEDSPAGVASAIAAGLKVIHISESHNLDEPSLIGTCRTLGEATQFIQVGT